MKKLNICFSLLVFSILLFTACSDKMSNSRAVTSTPKLEKYKFNSQNELIKLDADNYRRWVYVGTPLTPNDMNQPEAAFPEFHNVYIHPDDYNYWQQNGKWQDGTILVKELVLVGKKQEVSGNGYFMGDFTGLEVTIKDKKLFPDEPGNWAYFSFGHTYPLANTAKAFPTAACNSCHATSAEDDFVFTQNYPVLSAAKNSKNPAMGFLEKGSFEQEKELLGESDKKALLTFLDGK